MSITIMSAVWVVATLTHTEKLILLCLADNANDQGICWPSVENISTRCCVNKSTVSEVIDRLCEFGFVRKKKRFSQSTIYTVSGVAGKWPDQAMVAPSPGLRPGRPPVSGGAVPNRHRTIKEPASRPSNRKGVEATEVNDEVLPASWQDLAEARGIPDEQIFRSWGRFKEVSTFPYQVDSWKAWVARERINGRDTN